MNFFQKNTQNTLKELGVNSKPGLSAAEVEIRQSEYGENILEVEDGISPFKLLISQFKDVLIGVLVLAATLSLVLSFIEEEGSLVEPILIYGIVVAIALIGFFNEYKAEKTIDALKKLVGQETKVRRNGEVVLVDAASLVPGDIVILEEGQKIPADMRLLQANALQVDESSLTGESVPVSKSTDSIKKEVALADQVNMVFSGTVVSVGSGEAVVTAIGLNTQLGKIAGLVSSVEEQDTPMQKKLNELGRKIGAIVIVICLIVFAIIYLANLDSEHAEGLQRLIFAFTAAVALAVAAIPEGLAFVVRISLALGARRMADKNALVRKLSAVEALGSTNIICSDKTGTLTKGEMTVRKIWLAGGQELSVSGTGYDSEGRITDGDKNFESKDLSLLLSVGELCNNSTIKDSKVLGDPTEGALLVSASKYGAKNIFNLERVKEIPFTSDRKIMTTVHKNNTGYLVAVKGAPDVMLGHCSHMLVNGKKQKLTSQQKNNIKAENSRLAGQALRVLAFAYKETKSKPGDKNAEVDLVFLGLQAMMDPPREEVKQVMHRIHSEAGMRVIMITGDHIDTARAVAEEIGIGGRAIEGKTIDSMSDEDFTKTVEEVSVYARVNPSHKIKIVQALQANGHQVAMTGDGVNDAPAIKAADIGIAMGVTGTDATKEAADLILLDDQFLTIVAAIEEGRGIFDNVRKFVNYLLSANLAEVISVLGGVLMFKEVILKPAQLLFINIVTDGIPAVALGSDQAEKNIMRFKPRHYQGAIISKRIWGEMIAFGLLMSAVLLTHFWYAAYIAEDMKRAVSIAFVSMVVYELVRLIAIRIDYKIPWFSNPWLSISMFASFMIQLAVLYVAWLSNIFEVEPIQLVDWLVITVASVSLLVVMRFIDSILDRVLA